MGRGDENLGAKKVPVLRLNSRRPRVQQRIIGPNCQSAARVLRAAEPDEPRKRCLKGAASSALRIQESPILPAAADEGGSWKYASDTTARAHANEDKTSAAIGAGPRR